MKIGDRAINKETNQSGIIKTIENGFITVEIKPGDIVKWSVEAEQIGSHSFEVAVSVDSPFEIENDRNSIEFHLTKKYVDFQYDDYPCRILFSAILDSPHTSPIEINEIFWGVVKTTWSKGLQ